MKTLRRNNDVFDTENVLCTPKAIVGVVASLIRKDVFGINPAIDKIFIDAYDFIVIGIIVFTITTDEDLVGFFLLIHLYSHLCSVLHDLTELISFDT